MAITTLDGVLAGMQPAREFSKAATPAMVVGRPQSLWGVSGVPGAAAAPATGIGGGTLTSPVAGQIPYSNASSGTNYIARVQGNFSQAGALLIVDRLWHNSGVDVTATTEQTFTSSVQIPARDAAGTNAGDGVFAAVEVVTTMGAGTPTLTLKYTNQAGTAGQTATNIINTNGSATAGAFYPIGLVAGDTGIQKAESLTLSATWTSGAISVVLYRVLARLELPNSNVSNALDAVTGGFQKMYDGSVPFIVLIPSATSASNAMGQVVWAQG